MAGDCNLKRVRRPRLSFVVQRTQDQPRLRENLSKMRRIRGGELEGEGTRPGHLDTHLCYVYFFNIYSFICVCGWEREKKNGWVCVCVEGGGGHKSTLWCLLSPSLWFLRIQFSGFHSKQFTSWAILPALNNSLSLTLSKPWPSIFLSLSQFNICSITPTDTVLSCASLNLIWLVLCLYSTEKYYFLASCNVLRLSNPCLEAILSVPFCLVDFIFNANIHVPFHMEVLLGYHRGKWIC